MVLVVVAAATVSVDAWHMAAEVTDTGTSAVRTARGHNHCSVPHSSVKGRGFEWILGPAWQKKL